MQQNSQEQCYQIPRPLSDKVKVLEFYIEIQILLFTYLSVMMRLLHCLDGHNPALNK